MPAMCSTGLGLRRVWKLWRGNPATDNPPMHDMNAVFSWSLRLGQWRGTEIRASWLLGVWMLFEAVRFLKLMDKNTLSH